MLNVSSDSKSRPAQDTAHGITWGPWQAIIFAILIYVVAQIVAVQLTWLYPTLQGWPAEQGETWINTSVTAQFIYILIAECITVASLVWFIRARKGSLKAVGFRRPKVGDDVLLAFVGLVVYFLLFFGVVSVLQYVIPGLDVEQEQAIGFDSAQGATQLFIVFCSLVILPPIVEEFIFRGFVYSALRKSFKFIGAVILTSALFALPHLLQAENGKALWIAGIDTFVLSLVLCWLREKTGRLYAGIGVHALKNGVAFMILFGPQLYLLR